MPLVKAINSLPFTPENKSQTSQQDFPWSVAQTVAPRISYLLDSRDTLGHTDLLFLKY